MKLDAHIAAIAVADIVAERARQVEVEGWTPDHDANHAGGVLERAAAGYLTATAGILEGRGEVYGPNTPPANWPWSVGWWKPAGDIRRNLVKAGALIVAAIERLDRAAARKAGGQ